MPDFDEFLKTLKRDLGDLARKFGDDVKTELISDGRSFAIKSKQDLERWMKELVRGSITGDDFEWLVKGKRDLAEMEALKQTGLARARIDKYRNALLDTVISSAFKLIP